MQVLISAGKPEQWTDLPDGITVRFCGLSAAEVDAAITPDTAALVTDALPSDPTRCGGLQWIQLLSAGANQLLGHPLAEAPVRVANAAGIGAIHMAEHILGRLLYHQKAFGQCDALQRARQWPDRVALARPGLRGQCAVIVGYGGVGRETARLLRACGVRVIAVTSDGVRRPYHGFVPAAGTGDPDGTLPEQVVASTALADAAAAADVLVIAVPLTPTTRRLVDADVLAALRPHAILINVGRGAVLDTAALLAALDAGRLAHAYLDVFEQEPLPAESPLWQHPRLGLTPHMAGVLPDESLYRELFIQNLARVRAGMPLLNQIDPRAFRAR